MNNLNISKAEWFAAHAPAPPEWFVPVMPDKPKVRTRTMAHFRHSDNDEWSEWIKFWNDEDDEWYPYEGVAYPVPDFFVEQVNRYNDERIAEWQALKKWEDARLPATLFQWAKYYGEAMAAMFDIACNPDPVTEEQRQRLLSIFPDK